jgi:hypothetical protein
MPTRRESASAKVARFRVTLEEIAPPVWREFEIDFQGTFWDLHVAIQDVFGWLGYHLHRFEVMDPALDETTSIGIPDPDGGFEDDLDLPGWEVPIADLLSRPGDEAAYLYDFGDDWRHTVVLLDVGAAESGVKYPRCLDGGRACPPEDCGGAHGYEELLEALADPGHERHVELRAWAPEGFDPEAFDLGAIVFHDPKLMLRVMLQG